MCAVNTFFDAGPTFYRENAATRPDYVCVPRSFLVLMDYMIAFRYNQSDCERVGRSMTLTKTILRTSLGDLHFKQSVWIAHNSPGFHEVDLKAFVRRWMNDGHRSAVMKDDGAARAREVLERKRAEHKPSFLGMATEVG